MIRVLKLRLLTALTVSVLGVILGMLAGYGVGRSITLRFSKAKLSRESQRILGAEEAGATESRSVLAAMNSSTYPICSEAELTYFRQLIYRSEYLKGAGRMREGRMQCSTVLSELEIPREQLRPDFVRRDGTKLYRNLTPLRIGSLPIIMVELGRSFIVYNPFHEEALKADFGQYTVTEMDALSHTSAPLEGGSVHAPTSILTKDGQFYFGNTLYATNCSKRYTSCITSFITIPEALKLDHTHFLSFILLGGLIGGLFGLLLSFFHGRSLSLEQQLRRAIRQDKLHMAYQPIVDLVTYRIVGAEALARWTDDSGFGVGPETFVRLAEERGFVGEITRLAIRHALRDFGDVLRSRSDFSLSINVTAADLSDPNFMDWLQTELNRAKVLPMSLVIEITEKSTAQNEVAIETIRRLRNRGHRVYIDDFGTGYSSLSYLHSLSIDAIKIDKSFTRAIDTDSVTLAILPQILSMAETLNLDVIVEGVETSPQARYFHNAARPILAQGWLFGRPVPAEEFIRDWAPDVAEPSRLLAQTGFLESSRNAPPENYLGDKIENPAHLPVTDRSPSEND